MPLHHRELIVAAMRELAHQELGVLSPGLQLRHAPIAAEDQARVIAAILAEPAAHVGKIYTLCGPTELDQAGIAAAITEVLGRKISYQPLTIPQYR
jgi:uncharacterized protein YbjT (DUF2867 family)